MKTEIKCILVVLFLILGAPSAAKATLVDSNSVVQDGIEYYIQTDKSVYNLGEDVEIIYRVTNLSDTSVKIRCSQVPEINIWVEKDTEKIWIRSQFALPIISTINLSAGESEEIRHLWDMRDYNGDTLEPGVYSVFGIMYNSPTTTVSVQIGLVPEPCSVVMFTIVAFAIVRSCTSRRSFRRY